MIVSLEAIFLSTFVMISQNRQDDAVRPAGRLGGAGHGRRRTTRQTGRHGTVGAPHPIRQAHPRDGGSATQPPGATLRQSRLRDDPLHLQHLADLLAACLEVAPPLTPKHLTILKEALRARDLQQAAAARRADQEVGSSRGAPCRSKGSKGPRARRGRCYRRGA